MQWRFHSLAHNANTFPRSFLQSYAAEMPKANVLNTGLSKKFSRA
jgi:hypothetical protein